MADDEISTLYSDRASIYSSLIGEWDDLVMVYHGVLPSEFDDFFHEEMHRHVVNMIRLSWDDLSAMAGKVFPIYVDSGQRHAQGQDSSGEARADRLRLQRGRRDRRRGPDVDAHEDPGVVDGGRR